jgi:hypothetical protein
MRANLSRYTRGVREGSVQVATDWDRCDRFGEIEKTDS